MSSLSTSGTRSKVLALSALLALVALSGCGSSGTQSAGESSDRMAASTTPTGICLVNASGTPLEVTFDDNIFLDGKGPRTIPTTAPGACAGTDDSTAATVRRTDGSVVMRLDIGKYGNGEYFDGRPRPSGLFYSAWCGASSSGRDPELEMRSPSVGWSRTWFCAGFPFTNTRAADVGSRVSMDVTIIPK